ncbi:hypothetical protein [Actinoplanes sp. NPDC049681]|uniref:hypothetical protein n=1 Tax=Actinoplanes sp. NPDC049681 TaxID=3363905 RepID=UPI0037BD1C7C
MERSTVLSGPEKQLPGVSPRVVSSLRGAYPRGSAVLERAIAGALEQTSLPEVTDVEIHADHLSLITTPPGAATDVPFDVAAITPRGGTFDLILDYDQQTVFGLSAEDGDAGAYASGRRFLDALRPHYRLVEGAREPAASTLLLGTKGMRSLLGGVLERPDVGIVHAPIRAALKALTQGEDTGESEFVRNLRLATLELRRSGLDPGLQHALELTVQLSLRVRRGVQPVLALRMVPREAILAELGLDGTENLREAFADPATLAMLSPAHALDAGAVGGMDRDALLRIVADLRECEFLAVFLMGGTGPASPVLMPDTLDDATRLNRALSRTNAFLFSREHARRMDLAVPEYLPRAGSGQIAGFFPGLGSRAAYQNLGRALLESGDATVAAIYDEAATALGFPGQPHRLLPEPGTYPAGRMARQGFIGVALLVHSLALEARLRSLAAGRGVRLGFTAYAGESFGVITAAVASGALSVGDGVKIAYAFTPLMLQAAEGITGGGPFEEEIASYLPEPVRGHALVPEPHHVVGLRGDPEHLGALLDDLEALGLGADVEVHKTYSRQQTNVYVRAGVKAAFDLFLRKFPRVRSEELKAPTTFLAHSVRMRPARDALAAFLDDNGIVFARPRVPIVSNNDSGLLTTAAEVRNGVLAVTDEVMASRATVETLAGLRPDIVLELGPGGKSLQLLADNDVELPLLAWTGAAEQADLLLGSVRLMDDIMAELEKVYHAGDGLADRQYDLLRELFRLATGNPFAERYFHRAIGRIITNEMLHPDRDGAPAFYRFLEVFQHTRQHRQSVDVEAGELVLHARSKKHITGGADRVGRVYAELSVLDAAGAVADRSTSEVSQPEALVFHFDKLAEVGLAELARKTRTLLDAQPVARRIYDDVLEHLGIEDDGFLTLEGATAPTVEQIAVSYVVYQYALFQVLRLHRPAIFAHDYYLEGSDPMGWLVALAVSGAVALTDAVALYRAYLRVDSRPPELRQALDRIVTSLRTPDSPILSLDGIPLQTIKDLEATTRVVFA